MRFLILTLYFISFLHATPALANRHTNDNSQIADEFDQEFQAKEKNNDFDPFSGYNRVMTNFNDFFFINILDPASKGYKTIIPKPARNGIDNFFNNLLFPIRLVNNLLQLKFANSFEETQRFLLNSTIGIVGLNDIARDRFNLKAHNEDFGQTLGFYGIGGGIHIVWPILGQSNLRDTAGLVADAIINPLTYMSNRGYNVFDNMAQSYEGKALDIVNYNSFHVGEYEKLKKDAIDLYPFLKNIYEQRRKKLIEE
ncbi:MAG: VacJ family lipoprotein [Sulfurospirillaceae bacterium]|nr:VacJ family lipoprotein [Sulfurospirillaceae bacterium]